MTHSAGNRTASPGPIRAAQTFTGAPGKRSDITITALDALSDYGKRPMRSMLEQEILLRSPSAYYMLGENAGSTSEGDTSGNAQAVPRSR